MPTANHRVFFDSPENYDDPSVFYKHGGSPAIYERLLSYLKENKDSITELYLAFYLFNNYYLHQYLKELAESGVKIMVVSIPLDGYDKSNPQYLYGLNGAEPATKRPVSKKDGAKFIYREIEKGLKNYQLFVFPHIYLRSAEINPFSRGEAPFSLHIKSVWAKFKNGSSSICTTSSNLALRDQVKYEYMLLSEVDENTEVTTALFFSELIAQSIPVNSCHLDFSSFEIGNIQKCPAPGLVFYTAPFFEDSAELLEKLIIEKLLQAKKRILIAGQHVSAYEYFFKKSFKDGGVDSGFQKTDGFLKGVIQKAKEGLEVKIVSQTFVEKTGDNGFFRRPKNTSQFERFINAAKHCNHIDYYVNNALHSKYIIIDDLLFLSTGNFTPTQFIYLKHVNIPEFRAMPGYSYKGVFCEVGQHMFLHDLGLVKQFESNFFDIIRISEKVDLTRW